MVYVVNESTKQILFKIDAWTVNAEGKAREWTNNNGYSVVNDEITMMGDMVIWVR